MSTKIRRAKGEGSLRQRKDGRWEASWTYNGRRHYFYGKTKTEARSKMHSYINSTIDVNGDSIFDTYLQNWLQIVKMPSIKESSFDRLERTYQNHIKAIFGNLRIKDISSGFCQKIINDFSQEYSYSTVKKIYELLNACLTYAYKAGDIKINPLAIVKLPREQNFGIKTKMITIPSDEELQAYWQEADRKYGNGKNVYCQSYVAAFKLLSLTGCRCGELLALKFDHVSFDEATARIEVSVSEVKNRDKDGKKIIRKITETKTRNGKRTVRLNRKALDILEKLYDNANRNNASLVLLNEKGKPVSYHALQRTHSTICKRAGLVPWGLHTFRHWFASKCLANGVEVLALSKHLGHSNPTITLSTYAHLTEKQNDSFNHVLESI